MLDYQNRDVSLPCLEAYDVPRLRLDAAHPLRADQCRACGCGRRRRSCPWSDPATIVLQDIVGEAGVGGGPAGQTPPTSIAFDGTHIWVANPNPSASGKYMQNGTVTDLTTS